MREVSASRKEGALRLSSESVSKFIGFRDGWIVHASSDDDRQSLGEVLVHDGRLKPGDLELALTATRRTGESLGNAIVDMGFVSRAELDALAARRARAAIRSAFAWTSGEYCFEEGAPSVSEETAVRLSVADMIVEGIHAIEDPEVVRRGLGNLSVVLRQPKDPPQGFEEASLSSSVEWILYQANGVSTIEEIIAGSPIGEARTLRSVYALVAAGIVEVDDSPRRPAGELAEGREKADSRVPFEGSSPSPEPRGHDQQRGPLPFVPRTLGRYEIQGVLGKGAMGAVYLARDPALERTVAIKLIWATIHVAPADLEKYRQRFDREAKAAGKLLHPGIVTVFDVGRTEEDTPFIVMEYVEGRTLQEILKTGSLEQRETLRLAHEILDALGYAHSNGIVHRDIKPANIVVGHDGHVKIMDFGIAHVLGSELTGGDELLGSPHYMAPEQLSKETIDARTDLFAFGVVLYRMLTAELPFTGDSFAAIAKAILFEEPAAPESINPAVHPALSRVVLRCLAKKAGDRFASAGEVQGALRTAAAEAGLLLPDAGIPSSPGVSGPRPSVDSGPATRTERENVPAVGLTWPSAGIRRAIEAVKQHASRSPRRLYAALAAVLVALFLALLLFPRANDEPETKAMPQRLSFEARHNHRVGSCTGTLTLEDWGIGFHSEAHEWEWRFEDIRVMEREGPKVLVVETYEKDVLSFGRPKRYTFELNEPLSDEDWTRYRRRFQQTPDPRNGRSR